MHTYISLPFLPCHFMLHVKQRNTFHSEGRVRDLKSSLLGLSSGLLDIRRLEESQVSKSCVGIREQRHFSPQPSKAPRIPSMTLQWPETAAEISALFVFLGWTQCFFCKPSTFFVLSSKKLQEQRLAGLRGMKREGTQKGSTCGWGSRIQPVQHTWEGKGLLSPFSLSSSALQGKSNFIMAGAFWCQRRTKESYFIAKIRPAPDIMVRACVLSTHGKTFTLGRTEVSGSSGLAKEHVKAWDVMPRTRCQ